MKPTLVVLAVLSLALPLGCATDPNNTKAHAEWPDHTGQLDKLVDLRPYQSVTLVPFKNATDEAADQKVGIDLVTAAAGMISERYPMAFQRVSVDPPKGEPDELVVRGQVYGFAAADNGVLTKIGVADDRGVIRCDLTFENAQSGEVLKSTGITVKERGEDGTAEALLHEAAQELAKTIGRCKLIYHEESN